VLLVDDSIVRGTTSHEIVQMARDSGANKVYFASASPPVRYPNVYGIDMPTPGELIANGRSDDEIRRAIGADALVYQNIESMKRSVTDVNPRLTRFEASCFDGQYITGDITPEYLDRIERGGGAFLRCRARQRLRPLHQSDGDTCRIAWRPWKAPRLASPPPAAWRRSWPR
jgi:amidophosphoribosyltransferase